MGSHDKPDKGYWIVRVGRMERIWKPFRMNGGEFTLFNHEPVFDNYWLAYGYATKLNAKYREWKRGFAEECNSG